MRLLASWSGSTRPCAPSWPLACASRPPAAAPVVPAWSMRTTGQIADSQTSHHGAVEAARRGRRGRTSAVRTPRLISSGFLDSGEWWPGGTQVAGDRSCSGGAPTRCGGHDHPVADGWGDRCWLVGMLGDHDPASPAARVTRVARQLAGELAGTIAAIGQLLARPTSGWLATG